MFPPGGPWISLVSLAAGNTRQSLVSSRRALTLTITAPTTVGLYQGSVVLSCTGCQSVTVSVTLTVLTISPPSVSLNATVGTTVPVSTTVNVTSPGAFTASGKPAPRGSACLRAPARLRPR